MIYNNIQVRNYGRQINSAECPFINIDQYCAVFISDVIFVLSFPRSVLLQCLCIVRVYRFGLLGVDKSRELGCILLIV